MAAAWLRQLKVGDEDVKREMWAIVIALEDAAENRAAAPEVPPPGPMVAPGYRGTPLTLTDEQAVAARAQVAAAVAGPCALPEPCALHPRTTPRPSAPKPSLTVAEIEAGFAEGRRQRDAMEHTFRPTLPPTIEETATHCATDAWLRVRCARCEAMRVETELHSLEGAAPTCRDISWCSEPLLSMPAAPPPTIEALPPVPAPLCPRCGKFVERDAMNEHPCGLPVTR